MTTYKPLTKKIIGENGQQIVVCRYYGTDMCRKIHTPNECNCCPMIAAILEQLNIFEEVYLDGVQGEST